MRAMWRAHLILFHFITLVISGEAYKLRSYSLCCLLQLPATPYLLGPNILLSITFSNILNLHPSTRRYTYYIKLYRTLRCIVVSALRYKHQCYTVWRKMSHLKVNPTSCCHHSFTFLILRLGRWNTWITLKYKLLWFLVCPFQLENLVGLTKYHAMKMYPVRN
jgi:hypothetical protein